MLDGWRKLMHEVRPSNPYLLGAFKNQHGELMIIVSSDWNGTGEPVILHSDMEWHPHAFSDIILDAEEEMFYRRTTGDMDTQSGQDQVRDRLANQR
jgi:hypothetical protein